MYMYRYKHHLNIPVNNRFSAGLKIKKSLQKHQVMELTFHLYPPAATGIKNNRKSTWMNPIVDGEEGNKILGLCALTSSPFVWVSSL